MFFVKTGENLTQGFEIILKIDQNKAFCAIFEEIFDNFLKNFQINYVSRQNARKFHAKFWTYFENRPK